MNETLRAALARAAQRLRAAGIESARLDARLLCAHALGGASDAVFSGEDPDAAQLELFEQLVARRAGREPLAYITNHKEFWGLDFAVGPGVLIPRPETETLVEEALRAFPHRGAPLQVLDVGTGSGCLLISFLRERIGATGIGIDISEAALSFALRNAARHGVDGRSGFFAAAWEPPVDKTFDVILANLPYLSEDEFACAEPEIRNHEPAIALRSGPDGLAAMGDLARVLALRLSQGGLAFVEIGAGQRGAAGRILGEKGLDVRKAAPDLSGVARCLVIRRSERAWP